LGKTKRLTRVTAGRLVSAIIYTQAQSTDPECVRAAKAKVSSEARKRLNRRQSWEKLELLLAENFDRPDLWVTLTYDDDHLPESRAEALRCLEKFLRSLRQARRAAGQDLLYIKNVETLTKTGEPTRLHHHLVLNAVGNDYEIIRSLWVYGCDIELEGLLDNGRTYADIARYMAKERPPVGKNSWTPSRNLKRPKRESELVDDSLTLAPPPGAVILDREEQHNAWGEYVYLKYLMPYQPKRSTKRKPYKDYFSSGLG